MHAAVSGSHRSERTALGLAAAGYVAWFLLLAWLKPEWIADEQRHLLAIRWLAEGRDLPPGFLPMLPVYHLCVSLPARLWGPTLLLARSVNLGLALLALLLARSILKARGTPPTAALLAYAWNPLLFPFTAMAYTETAALVPLLAAALLHLRRRHWLSSAALAAATLVRQSSVLWAAYFAGEALLDAWEERRSGNSPQGNRPPWRTVLRSIAPHLLLLAVSLAVFLIRPSFAAGLAYANRAAVNPAQFYLFGLTVAVLWAPLWLSVLRSTWQAVLLPLLTRARHAAAIVAAVGLLEMLYNNPHPWNGDPLYLRNRPLMAMLTSLPLRLTVCTGLVVLGIAVVQWGRNQPLPRRRRLAWLGLCTLGFLAPHWLADPRYDLVPTVWFQLLAAPEMYRARRLLAWQALLTVALATYILAHGSPHGGIL